MRELLLATRSVGKIREFVPLFREFGFAVVSLADADIAYDEREDSLESFDSFEENALAKARWFATLSNGRIVVADDSGLVVDALNGMPGVRSKRWSGVDSANECELDASNNAFLWYMLKSAYAQPPITAHYECAAACVWSGGEAVACGATSGMLLTESRGTNGFGYDPHFFSNELGCTFGEASTSQKQAVSHRGRAFRALFERLMAIDALARA